MQKKHNKHYYYYLCLVEITLFSIINKQPPSLHNTATPTLWRPLNYTLPYKPIEGACLLTVNCSILVLWTIRIKQNCVIYPKRVRHTTQVRSMCNFKEYTWQLSIFFDDLTKKYWNKRTAKKRLKFFSYSAIYSYTHNVFCVN